MQDTVSRFTCSIGWQWMVEEVTGAHSSQSAPAHPSRQPNSFIPSAAGGDGGGDCSGSGSTLTVVRYLIASEMLSETL